MSKTVLVIDDDTNIRSATETILHENGFSPLLARNGDEALLILKKQVPDVVILDILMPKHSGIKLYQYLKTAQAFKQIPVIIHSGIARRTFLRSQEALDAFGGEPVPEPEGYLEKPVEPEELISMITQFFD